MVAMRLISLIVAALALSGPVARGAETERIVRLRVVADEESRRFVGWRGRIEEALAVVSERFGPALGLRFQVVEAGGWVSPQGRSLEELLGLLRSTVAREQADIVLGMTAQGSGWQGSGGLAAYLDGYAIVRDRGRRDSLARAIAHELAHLFGAIHLVRGDGLMASSFPSWRIDPANRALILAHQQRRFSDHEPPLPRTMLPAAVAAVRSGLEQGLDSVDGRIRLGWLLCESGAYEEALRWANEAVKAAPERPEAHSVLGIAARRLGRYDEAILAYAAVLQRRPQDAVTFYNLGIALAAKGDQSAAERCYRRAIELRPDYAEALSNLAKLEIEAGRASEAAELAERALQSFPDYPEASGNRCAALVLLGRPQEALAFCDRALAGSATLASVHDARGAVLLALGRFDEAVAAQRQALQLEPSAVQYRANLANALRERARRHLNDDGAGEAIQSYEELSLLFPEDGEALNNLAVLYYRSGQLELARDFFQRAVAAGISPNPELARALDSPK
jgi:tetratricopeptide (TPR) repeat protein